MTDWTAAVRACIILMNGVRKVSLCCGRHPVHDDAVLNHVFSDDLGYSIRTGRDLDPLAADTSRAADPLDLLINCLNGDT